MKFTIPVLLLLPQLLLAGDPANGEKLAQQNQCVYCHGVDGYPLQPMHPNLAGQQPRYLIWQLKAFRSGDRPSHVMNRMAQHLTDSMIEDLAAYYSSLGCKKEEN